MRELCAYLGSYLDIGWHPQEEGNKELQTPKEVVDVY